MAFRGSVSWSSRHDGSGAGVPAFLSALFFFVVLLAMGAIPSSATTEAELRAAVLSPTRRVLVVNSDILLTADLPQIVCPDLTIRGRCRRRLCKIDGCGRYRGFFQPTKITISGIELTRMSSETDPAAISGDSTMAPLIVLKNVRISYARNKRAVHAWEGRIRASNTVFFRNAAGALGLSSFTRLDGENLQFVANKASTGAAITSFEGIINCTNCVFAGNEALTGGAVAMGDEDGTEAAFYKCRFIGNRATAIGGGGGGGGGGGAVEIGYVYNKSPVRFCRTSFRYNTAITASGATVTDHVFIYTDDEKARVHFCPKRPRTGITITKPSFRPNVIDTCSAC